VTRAGSAHTFGRYPESSDVTTGCPPSRSLGIALAAVASGALAAPLPSVAGEAARDRGPADEELVQAAPPPFSEGVFPCSQCHEGTADPTRRTLAHHEDVQDRLDHANTRRWCLDCHDLDNRDMLHLSGGDLVPFTESYAVCAQCHYGKYRDWRLGIHGKRVGSWDGAKTYLLCVSCHDPHSPAMKPIRPERRPRRPEETRL
jgi:hypothetical protein